MSHMSIPVLGISCITNMAAGILKQKLTHQEVMDTTSARAEAVHGAGIWCVGRLLSTRISALSDRSYIYGTNL